MTHADAAVPAWLAAIAWDRRSAAFGPLHVNGGAVTTTYGPLSGTGLLPQERLRALWVDLGAHPNMLLALDDEPYPGRLVLEYAAIDWSFAPGPLIGAAVPQRRVATWGVQLCDVFDLLRRAVDADECGLFASPQPYIDLDDQVRLGFERSGSDAPGVAPELRSRWPRGDEAGLVYLVGTTLSRLVTEQHDSAVTDVIARCTAPKRRKRYGTLRQARAAFEGALARPESVRAGDDLDTWRAIEAALGWLATDHPVAACEALGRGGQARTYDTLRADVLAEARRRIAVRIARAAPPPRPLAEWPRPAPAVDHAAGDAVASRLPWASVAVDAAALEARHHDRDALALYLRGEPSSADVVVRFTAIARCLLALGDTGPAIDYARRALAADPRCSEACSIQYRAWLHRREPGAALAVAEQWLAIAPELGAAHHARGRALYALGRLDDAAASFDRALALDSTLLGAMLLRREIERARVGLRAVVGQQRDIAFDLPPRFADVRAALLAGDTTRAIARLSEPDHARDGAAQVLLGNCLAAADRYEEALVVFDRAEGMAPEVVRVALEGRARALESLGRLAEAADVHRRLVHASATGAELRVRTSR